MPGVQAITVTCTIIVTPPSLVVTLVLAVRGVCAGNEDSRLLGVPQLYGAGTLAYQLGPVYETVPLEMAAKEWHSFPHSCWTTSEQSVFAGGPAQQANTTQRKIHWIHTPPTRHIVVISETNENSPLHTRQQV